MNDLRPLPNKQLTITVTASQGIRVALFLLRDSILALLRGERVTVATFEE